MNLPEVKEAAPPDCEAAPGRVASVQRSSEPVAVNDMTRQYLAVLEQDASVEEIQEQLSALIQKLINARHVCWIPEPAAPQNGRRRASPELSDDELRSCAQLARTNQGVAVQASHGIPRAFNIAVHVPARGTLVSRLIANERTLPSFVSLFQTAAGYFVMARTSRLQSRAGDSDVCLRLLTAACSDISLSELHRVWCRELAAVAGAHVAVLCLKQGWRQQLCLTAISSRDDFNSGGEVSRTACSLARQAMSAADGADGLVENRGHCHASAADALSHQLGLPQSVAYAVVDSRQQAHGAVIFSGRELDSRKLQRAQTLIATTSPLLVLRQRSQPAGHSAGHGGTLRRLGWITAAVLVLAAIMALPVTYDLRCELTLEPITRRYVAAPFTGILSQADVGSGDIVEAGQLLAHLDDQPLRLKRAQLAVEAARLRKQCEVYRAQRKISEAQIAALKLKELEAESQLLEEQIQRSEICSPISGVVLSEDLTEVIDAPVELGQSLFEIAPLDELRARIKVPDEDVDLIDIGQPVQVWIPGISGAPLKGRLSRVSPVAEVQDGQNAVAVEVLIADPDRQLRPGMQGRAAIAVGQKQLGWIVFHRLWDQWRIYLPW